ncbi:sugar phosphate nucleotidyltransferase [Lachnotalea glycerini]|uniref:Phosphocholine cytidylyltransferase family protein n=1 Tax=Lachnotalea glycerini TaxID=1763509 RepID=A0A371J6A1_9FIRM|nr:sugar phosphate nucleotidyltransferase [Lachnotalea glycerini]RDY28275.1 phosphocholine cytidylyltransferase family protein [Lachnotalea glycerini]
MKAVILNSGIGSRLGKYTEHNPKCMVKISNNQTIIEYQIDMLIRNGITDIIISTGYMEELLKQHVEKYSNKCNITFVTNPEFRTTNYIVSLNYIEDIEDEVILMHGDLVFEQSVLIDMIHSPCSAVVIDQSLPLPEKDFKAKLNHNLVESIGIEFFGENTYASQPLYKFTKEEWKLWKQEISKFCNNKITNVYAEFALNEITDQLKINGLDINGRLCNEIDNEEDLIKIKDRLKRL